MNIHIITGSFFPELNPRAFRATELALELARKHTVTVTNFTYVEGFDYEKYGKEHHLQIKNIKAYFQAGNERNDSAPARWRRLFKPAVTYFLAGSFFAKIAVVMKELHIAPDTDMVLSSSVPFLTHYTVARFRRKHKEQFSKTIFIADSGDPFSTCQQFKKAVYFKWIEKFTYKSFDYLTLPCREAVAAYTSLCANNKIRIIPQGFNLDTCIADYSAHPVPHFAYAGVFYKGIRNPSFLFDYLLSLKTDFRFFLFLRKQDAETTEILDKYIPLMKDRLRVVYALERTALIYELSKMEFLINIGNTTTTQVPSKIIDYAITKRPFITIGQNHFDKEVFNEFLKGDYSHKEHIDIDEYDIKNIADKFLSLSSKTD